MLRRVFREATRIRRVNRKHFMFTESPRMSDPVWTAAPAGSSRSPAGAKVDFVSRRGSKKGLQSLALYAVFHEK